MKVKLIILKKTGLYLSKLKANCQGSYGFKMMDSKPQKINISCNFSDFSLVTLLTIKSNNLIIMSTEIDGILFIE